MYSISSFLIIILYVSTEIHTESCAQIYTLVFIVGGDGDNIGAIAGGVAGGLVLLALVVVGTVIIFFSVEYCTTE